MLLYFLYDIYCDVFFKIQMIIKICRYFNRNMEIKKYLLLYFIFVHVEISNTDTKNNF